MVPQSRALKLDSLSKQELRILALVARGLDDPAIGKRVGITHMAVRASLHRTYRKLGIVTNGKNPRVSAVLWYLEGKG